MANYRAIATGNWSNGATWAGGAVPPNNQGHDIYSNNFTVTIDINVNVNLITNASNAGTFVGGGTAAAGGGFTVSASGLTITSNVTTYFQHTSSTLTFTGGAGTSLMLNGNVTGERASAGVRGAVNVTGAGSLTVNGNIANSGAGQGSSTGLSASAGFAVVNGNLSTVIGNVSASFSNSNGNSAVYCTGTVNLTVNSGTFAGGAGGTSVSQSSIWQNGASTVVTLNNCIVTAGTVSPAVFVSAGSLFSTNGILTALNGVPAVSSTLVTASGTFVYAQDGTNPIGGARLILGTSPTNAYTQFALNGINANSFVRYYTADNNLGQANPTDVRSGVSYASGSLTGRLTVPARGSVALSVNYGPSMPFTATRSGTTATATLAYSYPLVVGDQITVTSASNSEWNGSYTVATVVSGTEVTFTVPNTHSATAGTGAVMQTTGTAVLDPAAVASAVWGAGSRTITGGVVDTLTNAPTVPTAAAIATQVRTELGTELGRLDANISSRLAPSGTLAVVTTLTNAPSVPSAASIADEVRVELATELARIDAPISGAGNAPSAATVASAVRTELSTELARVDQAISSRLAGSAYTAPANSDIAAIKSKTDALPASPAATGDIPTAAQNATAVWSKPANELTVADSIGERAKQQSTVAITGAQLAAALS